MFTQGMVCHETYKDQQNKWLNPEEVTSTDGKQFYKKDNLSEKAIVGPTESMSKSKKNTIDPESIIKNYGADSVRLFILSDSPPEKDVQWSDQGMIASFKFVQKLWTLNTKILEKIKIKDEEGDEKNNDPINITFNIMGAAAAAANLLYEFSIAPKKEAKHTKNKKGKVILLKSTARFSFSGSL